MSGGGLTAAFQLQTFKPAHTAAEELNYNCSVPCSDLVQNLSAGAMGGTAGEQAQSYKNGTS